MPHDVVVDVIVPEAPVVDVAAVGVQGPPGEPGEPGPAGPAGPQGEPGDAAGPHAATHQTGGVDPITALDAGVLTGTVTTNVIAPLVTATTAVVVGATPAQSGAIRLGNDQAIMARNAANNGDVSIATVSPANVVQVGALTGAAGMHFRSPGAVTVLTNGGAASYNMDDLGIYPGADGERVVGYPTVRFKNANLSESVNIGPTPPTTGALRLDGAIAVKEVAAPAVPPTDQARIWLQDNGAGKSQLMIQFATGAPVQIAIQS